MREILLEQNVHWHGRDLNTGIEREILKKMIPALEARHMMVISGGPGIPSITGMRTNPIVKSILC